MCHFELPRISEIRNCTGTVIGEMAEITLGSRDGARCGKQERGPFSERGFFHSDPVYLPFTTQRRPPKNEKRGAAAPLFDDLG
jgi:hypothetical protein